MTIKAHTEIHLLHHPTNHGRVTETIAIGRSGFWRFKPESIMEAAFVYLWEELHDPNRYPRCPFVARIIPNDAYRIQGPCGRPRTIIEFSPRDVVCWPQDECPVERPGFVHGEARSIGGLRSVVAEPVSADERIAERMRKCWATRRAKYGRSGCSIY